jgi:nicotinate phosphoribosyltransferase
MPSQPIIRSLLDTDTYKFTMWQPMLHHFPGNQARYEFRCRNAAAIPLSLLAAEVERELNHLCSLRFSEADLSHLASKRWFKSDFIDYLRIFQFQHRYIRVDTQGDALLIIAEGPQIHVMGFEIYVLSIVNELYFRRLVTLDTLTEARRRLDAKVALLEEFQSDPMRSTRPRRHPLEIFEFGTRRRFSAAWQEEVVETFVRRVPQLFKGSSNVALARQFGIAAIGTMAHEYLQSFQAVPGVQLKQFQKQALEIWVQEYRGDLGIALTDVVGMDAFLQDFDLYFAKLFDGLRHDSGDPIVWGEKALAHYAALRVDAHAKRMVFSDGLDIPTAIALYDRFADRVGTGFGIGTNLTNDTGIPPLNIVMKLVTCNGQPVAKLSDSPGKAMCDDATFLAYLKQVFHDER